MKRIELALGFTGALVVACFDMVELSPVIATGLRAG